MPWQTSFPRWFIFAITLFPALAVFSDEAYHVDYHHALLGVPQLHTTFFHRPFPNSKASLLYSLSEKGVLGAINPKDGAIVWRQLLVDKESSEIPKGLLGAITDGSIVFSAINGHVQAWDAAEGRLVWEQPGSGVSKDLVVLDLGGLVKDILTLTAERPTRAIIRKLAADSGKALWEFEDESGATPLGLSPAGNHCYYISSNPAATNGPKIIVKTLDSSSGKLIDLLTLKTDHNTIFPGSILYTGKASPILVWTDTALQVLNINVIGSEHIFSFQIRYNNDEQVGQVFAHAHNAAGAQVHLLVHYQSETWHSAEVYHINLSSRSAKKAYDLPLSNGYGTFSASARDGIVYFTRITQTEISLFSSLQKNELAAWPMSGKMDYRRAHSQTVLHAVSEIVSKGKLNYAVRSALVLPTGDLELIRNGEHVWLRPESLAGVVAAAFIEPFEERRLATELAMESHSILATAYMSRVKRHLMALKRFPAWAMPSSSGFKTSLLGARLSKAGPGSLDGFGFGKLVIVATESGRLIALDTGNQGRIIWNVKLFDSSLGHKGDAMSIEPEDDRVLIRGHRGEFWRVLISNGTVTQHHPGETSCDFKVAIAILDAWGEKLLVSVKEDGILGNYSESKAKEGITIVTRGIQGAVRGWRILSDKVPVMAWEFWPFSGDVVTNVITRPTHDPIASIGKALGDRNVLYKYTNANILLVITTSLEDSKITVNLLDSASGHILHTAMHWNVDKMQPVEGIASENWLAYTLFGDVMAPFHESMETKNSSSKGFQLIVAELFNSQYHNERGALDSRSNFSSIYPNTISDGISTNSPHIMSQAYSIPGPVSLLSITSTFQGITPRSLLCFLPYQNALISIPRTVLDPRRPVDRDPYPAELEEGLFKHNTLLEFEPKWVLNHKREIFSLRGIITSPSLLESTSLVFSYGKVDIFGTRVSPIGGFDLLGKGFSKSQLLGTVIALAIGTGVVAPMVSFPQPSPIYHYGRFSSNGQVRKKQIGNKWHM